MELGFLILKVLLGIGFVLLPITVYSWADSKLSQRAIDAVGQAWCLDNGKAFVRVERFERHLSLVYREGEHCERRKFVAKFTPLTWHVSQVVWLSH